MKLIIDSHIHIYGFHQTHVTLESLVTNLSALSAEALAVACLTESADCHVFDELKTQSDPEVARRFNIDYRDGALELKANTPDKTQGPSLILLPGQQIITQNNLEVLSLATSERIENRLDEAETISRVLAAGGVPVVAWSVGKWFGRRGKIVNQLLDDFRPDQFVLGDTLLRPIGWATPIIMRRAQKKGFKVLCGSDPFPLGGEEVQAGRYASLIDFDPESQTPSQAIQNLLNSPSQPNSVGRRGSVFSTLRRIFLNDRNRKSSA